MRISSQDLLVIDAKVGPSLDLASWTEDIFCAERCKYHLYLLTTEDEGKIPGFIYDIANQPNGRVTIYRGEEAYARVLQSISGLLNEQIGESGDNAVDKMKIYWDEFKISHPEAASRIEPLMMQALLSDIRLIRKHFLEPIKGYEASFEYAAIQAAEVSQGDFSLIIGTQKAETVARLLGKSNTRTASEIWLSDPDDTKILDLYEELQAACSKKEICCPIYILPFDNAQRERFAAHKANLCKKNVIYAEGTALDYGMLVADHVFICRGMDAQSPIDHAMMAAWAARDREAYPGNLIHTRGSPKLRAATDPAWVDAFPAAQESDVILPEAIKARQAEEKANFDHYVAGANNAIRICATSRESGNRPCARNIVLPYEDYFKEEAAKREAYEYGRV